MGALTDRMKELGESFSGHRKRLFARLSEKQAEIYSDLVPDEHLRVHYESSWVRRGLPEDDPILLRRELSNSPPGRNRLGEPPSSGPTETRFAFW